MPDFFRLSLDALDRGLPAAFARYFDPRDPSDSDFARHGFVMAASLARAVPKRQAEFLAGRRCAIAALREQGCSVSDIAIGADRAPVWPQGFLGSITHSDGIAAAVVTGDSDLRGVGIDIERIPAASGLDALRQLVLVDDERRTMDVLAGEMGTAAALTTVFSAKESFYKATAKTVGRVFDFSAVRVLGMGDAGLLDLVVNEDLVSGLSRGMRFHASVTWLDERMVMTACAW